MHRDSGARGEAGPLRFRRPAIRGLPCAVRARMQGVQDAAGTIPGRDGRALPPSPVFPIK